MNVHLRNVVVNVLAAAYVLPVRWRVALMRAAGVEVGEGTSVRSRCTVAGPSRVAFGAGGYVSYQCIFDATGEIIVGDRVYIASGVSIGTCTHDIGDSACRAGRQFPDPVQIGDGVWVGMNVAILPGVTVGSGCVLAAGSVIASDCEPDCLYAGVPAKLVRRLEPGAQPLQAVSA